MKDFVKVGETIGPPEEVEVVLQSMDHSGDGQVSLHEFVEVVAVKYHKAHHSAKVRRELKDLQGNR